MGLREEKKERQRRELFDAAIALFRERGYQETRVQDVIERAGVSEGTFFNYFPTKDAVLQAFVFEYVSQYEDALSQALAADQSVSEKMSAILSMVAGTVTANRDFMKIVVPRVFSAEGQLRDDELRAYEVLIALFRLGQETGEIRGDADPRQLAEMVTAIAYLTIMNWLVDWWGPNSDDLEQRLRSAWDVFFAGARA